MRVYSLARRPTSLVGSARKVARPVRGRWQHVAQAAQAAQAARAALGLLVWFLASPHARAEAGRADSAANTLIVQAEPGVAESLSAALSARFPAAEWVRDPREWLRRARQGIDPGSLSALSEIEDELSLARRSAAELDERAALLRLAHAEVVIRRALGVPGAAAFYAEIEVQLGITAAQAGLPGLASASLRRAAHLDPGRKLLAGEANPELVALAARLWNEAESAPEGELALAVNAKHAHVFVDDVERGEAPLRVRASCGEHVLRVEAPEHLAYGAVVVVEQGPRPAMQIALAPDPAFVHLAELERAAAGSDFAHLPAALDALAGFVPSRKQLVVIEAAAGRALLVPCAAEGCTAPERVLAGRIVPALSAEPLRQAELDEERAWLHGDAALASAPPALTPAQPLWKRWYAWSALAVLVGAAGALVAVSASPVAQRELHVVVDPKGLR